MMAALLVLDNFKMGIGRQQTVGVFIPKRCSEPLFASNDLGHKNARSVDIDDSDSVKLSSRRQLGSTRCIAEAWLSKCRADM
jgi:hypothetical protein